MGAVAALLPGALDLTDQDARGQITRTWKEDLPVAAGATLIEMIDQAQAGVIKGLFVVGENPVGSLPPQTGVKEALAKLDLLVCQELFLTETAALAHVVLPAASAMEKAGTFTNTEGHVQAVRPAIDPVGDSRPDWEILSAFSVFMGVAVGVRRFQGDSQRDPGGDSRLRIARPFADPSRGGSCRCRPICERGISPGPCDSVYSARAGRASGWNDPVGADPEPVPFRQIIDPFEGTAADRTERVLADESRGRRPVRHRHGRPSPPLEQPG